MEVYSEPIIEGCNAVPDFYIVNPNTKVGKLVEITLREKNQGRKGSKKLFLENKDKQKN